MTKNWCALCHLAIKDPMLSWKNSALGAALATCLATSAGAQVVPNVEPGRIQDRFEGPRIPSSDLDAPAVKLDRPDDGPPLDDSITFTLEEVILEGATVFDVEELKPLYEDYLNTEVPLGIIQKITGAITTHYRNEGYVLSQAILPPQRIEDGTLRIRVIEGFVDQVMFEGKEVQDNSVIQAYIKHIRASKPLHISVLERYLLLIDDLAGVRARGTLAPSEDVFAASNLIISLNSSPFEGRVGFDNRGSRFLGPLQGDVSVSANNHLGLYEQVTARTVGTLNLEELKYGLVNYQQPLGGYGTNVRFSASHARTEPGAGLRSLDIEGKSTTLEAQLSHPVIRSRTQNVTATLGFTMRNSESETLAVNVFEDHIRTLEAGVSYDAADSLRGVNQISASFTQGLGIFGSNDENDLVSRGNADASFSKVEAQASRFQAITGGWSTQISAKGQYAFDPLFSSEEFDVGGASFGSAYDASEVTGDHGLAARAEMQYRLQELTEYMDYMQLYSFYDVGRAWNEKTLIGETKRESLASAGIGTRFAVANGVTGSVEFAVPLTKRVAAEATDGEDARFFFTLGYSLY